VTTAGSRVAVISPSGPDGVGRSEEWAELFLNLGVTDRCDQKSYAEINPTN